MTLAYQIVADASQLERELTDAERKVQRLDHRAAQLEGQLEEIGSSGARALNRTDDELLAMARSTERATRRAARLEQQYREVAREARRARGAAAGIGEGIRGGGGRAGGGGIGSAFGALGGGLGGLTRAIGPAGIAIAGLTGAATGAALAFAGLASNASAANARLAEQRSIAQGLGVDQSFIAETSNLAQVAGVQLDAGAFAQLGERIGEARRDPESEVSQRIAETLATVGADVATATSQDLFNAIQQIEDPNERGFVATEILGGELAERIGVLNELTAEQAAEVRELTRAEQGRQDALARGAREVNLTGLAFRGLFEAISARLAPAFEDLLPQIRDVVSSITDWISYSPSVGALVNNLVTITSFLLDIFRFIGRIVGAGTGERGIIEARREANNTLTELNQLRQTSERTTNRLISNTVEQQGISRQNTTDISNLTMANQDALQAILPRVECNTDMIDSLTGATDSFIAQVDATSTALAQELQDRLRLENQLREQVQQLVAESVQPVPGQQAGQIQDLARQERDFRDAQLNPVQRFLGIGTTSVTPENRLELAQAAADRLGINLPQLEARTTSIEVGGIQIAINVPAGADLQAFREAAIDAVNEGLNLAAEREMAQ